MVTTYLADAGCAGDEDVREWQVLSVALGDKLFDVGGELGRGGGHGECSGYGTISGQSRMGGSLSGCSRV